MFENILVPYDGSESANKALSVAMQIGSESKPLNITVLQVIGMRELDQSTFEVALRMAGLTSEENEGLDELRSSYESAYKDKMRESVSDFFSKLPANVDLKIVIKRGDPRDVICNYAEENDMDCIVMGRRGLSGIRATLGSVSTAVLRGTELPVLVVK